MHKKRLFITIFSIILVIGAGIATWLLLPRLFPLNNSTPAGNNQPTKPVVVVTPISCVEKLPTDVKIGQKLMLASYSDQLATETPTLAASKVGGIIVMDQTDKASLDAYTANMAIIRLSQPIKKAAPFSATRPKVRYLVQPTRLAH